MSTESSPRTPVPANGRRPSKALPLVGLILAVAVVGYGVRYWLHERLHESTDDAAIESTIVQMAPQVGGRVLKVTVSENTLVNAGDALVEIDPAPYAAKQAMQAAAVEVARSRVTTAQLKEELAKATTDAGLRQAEAAVRAAQAAAEQAQAAVTAAEAESARAQKDFERYRHLENQAVSVQQRDLAEAAARVAAARVIEAHKQAATAEAQVASAQALLAQAQTAPQQIAVDESEVAQRAAELAQAEAALRSADLDLSYTRISAPMTGKVTKKNIDAGEFVQPGQALFSLVEPRPWVVANFKETQLNYLRPGQKATITVDAYPDLVLHGHVDSIQLGSGSRFSILPPENATGNFVKIVQRVPVKILLDDAPPEGVVLGPGMSAVPTVRVR